MAVSLILAVGWDPVVLSTRCAILKSAGYIVRSVSTVAEASKLIQSVNFDLLLLCHSIPIQDRDQLIRVIRSASSRIPIYAVDFVARDFHAGLADGIISSRPEILVKQLGDVMELAPPEPQHRPAAISQGRCAAANSGSSG